MPFPAHSIVKRSAVCLAAMIMIAGSLPAQQLQDTTSIVLRPGDALRITVWREPELSGQFTISQDGTIRHPLYQDIVAAGVDLPTLRAHLRTLLAQYQAEPRFVIEPLLRVSVGGEVRQPSLYTLPPETSIAEAVALAGGATDRGRLDRVHLLRGGQEITVDLLSPHAGMAQTHIRSGDQIYVDRSVSVFREYIAPAGSITAALVTFIALIIRH
jgi:protein involved in polysaccharide export with SLBB domain